MNYYWRGKLLQAVNVVLILLAITLSTVVRCQDSTTGADLAEFDGAATATTAAAVGSDDVKIRAKSDQVRLVKSECAPRQEPGLVGGHQEVDVSEPEHQQRIRDGLNSYRKGKLSASKFVIRCGTVQLVAGTIHRYTVDLLDANEQLVSTCNVKIYTPLRDEPEYKFDCQEQQLQKEDNGRVRRDVERKKLAKAPKAGAPAELTAEEYSKPEHTDRIRHILLTAGGSEHSERKYRIVGATQQLVAGNLYTYRLVFTDDPDKRVCKLTLHERPWLEEKSPAEARKASFSCPDKKRTKRDLCVGCPEGMSAEELAKDEHRTRINKAIATNGLAAQKNLEIINGTHQVVAGSRYTYFVELDDANGERKLGKIVSWERVWLEESEPEEAYKYYITFYDRSERGARRKRAVGGPTKLSEEDLQKDEHIQRINKILVSSGGVKQDKPKVINGTVQVVSGKSYTYYLAYDVDSVERICYLNSWERPWLESKDPSHAYIYTFRCNDPDGESGGRSRRHAKKVGGSNELSAEDLKDRSHIERVKAGLVGYNEKNSKSYEDFEITKGSVQLVAGSLYKYTFKVKGDPEVVCKISVWERIWLENQDQRKFNVKCDGDEVDGADREHQFDATKRSVRSVRPRPEFREGEHYSKGEQHARHQFEKFKLKHNRTYQSSLEHEMRFRIFKNNLFKIEQLNKYEQGTAKYGITHFADMTSTEYRERTGLVVPHDQERNHIRNPLADIDEHIELPEAFDWRELGAVSPVKNQGNCGSCWAFSVVGNIEGLHYVRTKQMEEYSEQELLDCDTVDGACQGGFMDDAYKAIEKIGGLELESEYPYLAKKQKTCHFNKTLVHVRVKGAIDLPKNETAMAQFLVANGPISIGLNANAMQFYRGGISHPWHPLCSKKNLDHGVLIVGYGVKEYPMFNKTLPYWIVKNSWGPKWGEQGYYRIYRGDNSCGVSEMVTSAVLE